MSEDEKVKHTGIASSIFILLYYCGWQLWTAIWLFNLVLNWYLQLFSHTAHQCLH